jgi:hypothetical protein
MSDDHLPVTHMKSSDINTPDRLVVDTVCKQQMRYSESLQSH